mgnify:CR=1 FL=1
MGKFFDYNKAYKIKVFRMEMKRVIQYAFGALMALGVGSCCFSDNQKNYYRSLADKENLSASLREEYQTSLDTYSLAKNASSAAVITGLVGLIIFSDFSDKKERDDDD